MQHGTTIKNSMVEQLKKCNQDKHDLQKIYKVAVNDFEDDVVLWCMHCGCVQAYRIHECGKVTHTFSEPWIPQVTKAYWNEHNVRSTT